MDDLPNSNYPRDERGVSNELQDELGDVGQTAPDELLWHDSHFGEPPDRMFTSLQLRGSSPVYESFDSPQHHSLDDMISHRGHQRGAKGFTANGKSRVRVDDDDDDNDDIDIETMKNKFLSAWTNAKNG